MFVYRMFVCLFVCSYQTCLKLSIFINLAEVSLRSLSGLSQVSLSSLLGLSQVSLRSLLGLSQVSLRLRSHLGLSYPWVRNIQKTFGHFVIFLNF